MRDTTQDAEKIEDIMALADEYAHRRWSAAVSACHFDKLGEKQADADAAEARAALDAAIRQAMGDDAAPTDRIGAALAAPGSERLRDYYATGPVQRASVETFVAALGVPSLQSVASAETCRDAAGVETSDQTQENKHGR